MVFRSFGLLASTILAVPAMALSAADGATKQAPLFKGAFLVHEVVERHTSERIRLKGQVNFAVSEVVMSGYGSAIRRFPVRPGSDVRAGDVLAEVDTSYPMIMLTHYRSQTIIDGKRIAAAIEEVAFRERNFERATQLVEKGLSAPSALSAASAAVESARGSLGSLRIAALATQRLVQEWEAKVRLASFLAPVAGKVIEMGVNPAQLAGTYRSSGPILISRIVVPGRYKVRAKALASQRARLSSELKCVVRLGVGASLPCKLSSLPSIQTAVAKGAADPSAGGVSGFDVEAEFSSKLVLPPDVEVELVLTRATGRHLAVPVEAIVATSSGDFVDKAGKGPDGGLSWTRVPIEVLASGETFAAVAGSINSGDRIRVPF